MFGPGSNNGIGEGGGNYNNDMKKAKSQVSLIRFLFYYTFYCLFHFITLFIIGSVFHFRFLAFLFKSVLIALLFYPFPSFFYFFSLYTALISTLFRSLLTVSVSSLFITFCNDQAPTAGGFDIGLPTLRKLMDLLRLDAVGIVSKVRERESERKRERVPVC